MGEHGPRGPAGPLGSTDAISPDERSINAYPQPSLIVSGLWVMTSQLGIGFMHKVIGPYVDATGHEHPFCYHVYFNHSLVQVFTDLAIAWLMLKDKVLGNTPH